METARPYSGQNPILVIFDSSRKIKLGLPCPSRHNTRGFPGGSLVKNPPANAGDTGLSPGQKIPRTAEQLSLCATTTEPAL